MVNVILTKIAQSLVQPGLTPPGSKINQPKPVTKPPQIYNKISEGFKNLEKVPVPGLQSAAFGMKGSAGRNWILDNIVGSESAGDFKAMGAPVGGDRAYGAFQFMGSTLRSLGFKGDFNQFLNSPKMQYEYANKYLDSLAASSGGKLNLNNPTINDLKMAYAGWYGGPGAFSQLNNSSYMNKQWAVDSGAMFPSIYQAQQKIAANATKFTPFYKPKYLRFN